jgi:ABC-2 type transport system ATP-binding protein
MIEFLNVKKTSGSFTLNIPELFINRGEIVAITGNNGAGKTTLFRILSNLIKLDTGSIRIDKTDIQKSDQLRLNGFLGIYIDEMFLIPYLTPREYWLFLLKCYGFKKNDFYTRISEFNEFLGFDYDESKLIRDLSSGQKAKVGIIGALIHEPQVLILDEPLSYLAKESQKILVRMFKEQNKKHKVTILLSGHHLEQIDELLHQKIILHQGQIVRVDRSRNENIE